MAKKLQVNRIRRYKGLAKIAITKLMQGVAQKSIGGDVPGVTNKARLTAQRQTRI